MSHAIRAGRDEADSLGHKRKVRIVRLVEIYATETPLPAREVIAARLGCSLAAVQRDLGTLEFARGLEEHLAGKLADVVDEVVQMHLDVMHNGEKASDRLAAGRWLYARWQGARKVSAAIRGGDEPEKVRADESELLAQVMRETQEQREQKK